MDEEPYRDGPVGCCRADQYDVKADLAEEPRRDRGFRHPQPARGMVDKMRHEVRSQYLANDMREYPLGRALP